MPSQGGHIAAQMHRGSIAQIAIVIYSLMMVVFPSNQMLYRTQDVQQQVLIPRSSHAGSSRNGLYGRTWAQQF